MKVPPKSWWKMMFEFQGFDPSKIIFEKGTKSKFEI